MNNIILKTDISHGLAYKDHIFARIKLESIWAGAEWAFPIYRSELLWAKVKLYLC